MSTLASTFPPDDVLVFGNAQTVIGTAMLGDDFGKIKSMSVKRTGDEEELTNGTVTDAGNNITAPTYPTF